MNMQSNSPWDPFRELLEMQNRLSTVLGRAPLRQGAAAADETLAVADWAPLVDISEDSTTYRIEVELPGVPKDAVRVTVDNGQLVVSGERVPDEDSKNRKYHRSERAWGRFVRSFLLPDDADANEVQAAYRDGVLVITIAKVEQARPKQVEIKVS